MITRYTLFYTGLFIAVSILAMVVLMVLDLEGNTGLNVVISLVTAMFIGQVFAREQRRPLEKKERHQLAAAFTVVATVFSLIVLIAIFLLTAEAGDLAYVMQIMDDMAGILVIISIFALALQYGLSWLGLGFGVKAALKQQAAQEDAATKSE